MSDTGFTRADYAAVTTDDLVTGEAVALDLPPANLAHRMVSGMIDFISAMVLLLVLLWITLLATAGTDQALLRVASIGAVVTALLVFPTAFETLTRGRSLGKLAMGLRTVRDDAGPISFQHAWVRALIGLVEVYLLTGTAAFLSSMLSSRGKRLGDYAAGTYVVRERVPLALAPPVPMPPPLAVWARSADIANLPTGLSLAVRQFLGRAHLVEPHSRALQSTRLAQQVAAYVAPPPPVGTPAEAFLAAVIASRRDRDLARLTREAQQRYRLLSRR